jgi:hypothetical protein
MNMHCQKCLKPFTATSYAEGFCASCKEGLPGVPEVEATSPTPWRKSDVEGCEIVDANGEQIVDCESRNQLFAQDNINRALILTAVNAHEKLVDLARKVKAAGITLRDPAFRAYPALASQILANLDSTPDRST